ncbi:helix-turn-helix domain-containing protein [Trichlorobacter lovleyi]|uniref:helix-turn-helix domain-containing protein n=1 Tax=Trichlorobacter lovleyi TaxID=313985 RepID=UPI0023F30969|nr:helix-turn-helix domain-containing protein [Trichlorobacter lovleyi]
MDLPERIKIARESIGKSQKDMANALGASLPSVQNYESGKSVPGGDVIKAFVKLGFNANWLLTGEGEMRWDRDVYRAGGPDVAIVIEPTTPFAQDAESEELCRLLKRYGNRALVEDVKARLLKIKAVVEG